MMIPKACRDQYITSRNSSLSGHSELHVNARVQTDGKELILEVPFRSGTFLFEDIMKDCVCYTVSSDVNEIKTMKVN